MHVDVLCFSENTRRFSTGGSSTCKDRPVPGRASSGAHTDAGRFVQIFFKAHGAFKTLYDAQPGTVWFPDGLR